MANTRRKYSVHRLMVTADIALMARLRAYADATSTSANRVMVKAIERFLQDA